MTRNSKIACALAGTLVLSACSSETSSSTDVSEEADGDMAEEQNDQAGEAGAETGPISDIGQPMRAGAWEITGRVVEFDFVEGMPPAARDSIRVGNEFSAPEPKCLSEEAAADLGNSDFFVPNPQCQMLRYEIGDGGIYYHAVCQEGALGGMADNIMEGSYGSERFAGAVTYARQFENGDVGRIVVQMQGRRVGDC